jgi:methionyl-tRNA formyltransferase
MRIDAEMDHGPILAQKNITVSEWPTYEVFEEMMAREGGKMLAEALPGWIAGTIHEVEQDHGAATYTKKIKKEDGEVVLDPNASTEDQYAIFRKIQAFHEWPTAFFFTEKNGVKIRVKITRASFSGGKLVIEKIIPEGKPEISFDRF